MWRTWVLTVPTPMPSSSAISLERCPLARSRKMSFSRGDCPDHFAHLFGKLARPLGCFAEAVRYGWDVSGLSPEHVDFESETSQRGAQIVVQIPRDADHRSIRDSPPPRIRSRSPAGRFSRWRRQGTGDRFFCGEAAASTLLRIPGRSWIGYWFEHPCKTGSNSFCFHRSCG
jgi:hypothetical protein